MAAAITPGAAVAAPCGNADDPVFAAIERHRAAMQAWLAEDDEERSNRLPRAERAAWHAWVMTAPTTMAGLMATLEHASSPNDDDCTRLAQFPAMIAEAPRKIAGN